MHKPFESALDFRIPALRPSSRDATESRPEPMSVSVCADVVLPALDFPDALDFSDCIFWFQNFH